MLTTRNTCRPGLHLRCRADLSQARSSRPLERTGRHDDDSRETTPLSFAATGGRAHVGDDPCRSVALGRRHAGMPVMFGDPRLDERRSGGEVAAIRRGVEAWPVRPAGVAARVPSGAVAPPARWGGGAVPASHRDVTALLPGPPRCDIAVRSARQARRAASREASAVTSTMVPDARTVRHRHGSMPVTRWPGRAVLGLLIGAAELVTGPCGCMRSMTASGRGSASRQHRHRSTASRAGTCASQAAGGPIMPVTASADGAVGRFAHPASIRQRPSGNQSWLFQAHPGRTFGRQQSRGAAVTCAAVRRGDVPRETTLL